ncbi:hypothetical protein B0H19DRAFT_1060515 [Mycena capillaripes]|nr:hypothetical protein B0H19DRAFT_1060515 [Mycena capillaripes]
MTPIPGDIAAFEVANISTCAPEREHWRNRRYRRCVVTEGVFVKYGGYRSLSPEIHTQMYIRQTAERDISAPRVPKILHFFNRDIKHRTQSWGTLSLHPIQYQTSRKKKKVALALQWLRDLSAPPDLVRIGSLGNGLARHRLFEDDEAPLPFLSIEARERKYVRTYFCFYEHSPFAGSIPE